MSETEVKPDKLRAFGDMLGEGGDEAKSTRDAVGPHFVTAAEDAGGLSASSFFNKAYAGIGGAVDEFYEAAEIALDSSKAAHRDMASDYEKTDADNADQVGSAYRDDKYVEYEGDSAEEHAKSAGRSNHSDTPFEYVPCATTIAEPDKAAAAQDGGADPQKRIAIPEFKDYPEAVAWAASWGMDVAYIALHFVGDWPQIHASNLTLRDMAKINNEIAGNVVEGNAQIAETWKGESAEASQKFMGWVADNICGCENTLEALNQELYDYIGKVDDIATALAAHMSMFLWEADWARWSKCPEGPMATSLPSAITDGNGIDGMDAKTRNAYLTRDPLEFEIGNLKDLKTFIKPKGPQDGAYLGMVWGLLHQYSNMFYYLSDLWELGAGLTPAAESAITDLEEARERLDSFQDWGKHDPHDGT